MVGNKYTRTAILIMFAFLGILLITSNENKTFYGKNYIQIDNAIEVEFEDFSKIKESMRYSWF